MGRGLILVRHALPEVTRGLSSTLWPLSEASREDCVLLAHHLPDDLAPVVIASTERKVEETAQVIALRRGLQVRTDRRIGEVQRPDGWIDDYRAVAGEYLRGKAWPDWEPREAVVRRFAACVDEALAQHSAGDLILVDGGMAMSLFAASRWDIDLVPFWQGLTFPDAWRFDLSAGEQKRLFLAGQPPPDA